MVQNYLPLLLCLQDRGTWNPDKVAWLEMSATATVSEGRKKNIKNEKITCEKGNIKP